MVEKKSFLLLYWIAINPVIMLWSHNLLRATLKCDQIQTCAKCSMASNLKKIDSTHHLLRQPHGTRYHWHTHYVNKRGEHVPLHFQEEQTIGRANLAPFGEMVTVWP